MKSLGIIGFGIMGEAFARGLAAEDARPALTCLDTKRRAGRGRARREVSPLARRPRRCCEKRTSPILCVKPQDFAGASLPRSGAARRGKRVISILAGRALQTLSRGPGHRPGGPVHAEHRRRHGRSLVGVSFGPAADAAFRADSLAVAGGAGHSPGDPGEAHVRHDGVSGSGIAFVLAFVHAMAMGGVAAGFDYPTAAVGGRGGAGRRGEPARGRRAPHGARQPGHLARGHDDPGPAGAGEGRLHRRGHGGCRGCRPQGDGDGELGQAPQRPRRSSASAQPRGPLPRPRPLRYHPRHARPQIHPRQHRRRAREHQEQARRPQTRTWSCASTTSRNAAPAASWRSSGHRATRTRRR